MDSKGLPILFVIFNRKDIAAESFRSIREFQPSRLYIACDGPRADKPGEESVVKETREKILGLIDWDCEVKTLFRESNLGCGQGVYTAIDWFFSHEEYGVILEDDCIARQSFFRYAQEMLERYREDERIGMIAGTNPVKDVDSPCSVLFSKYKSCWGWGTWRRAWKNMDIDMTWRRSGQADDVIRNCGYHGEDARVWKFKLGCIDRKEVSAWDWQWYFSLSAQNQLCVYPKVNLISNIGDDPSATHTSFSDITFRSYELDFPLTVPRYVVPDEKFDKAFYNLSNTFIARLSRIIPYKAKKTIKSIIAKCRK